MTTGQITLLLSLIGTTQCFTLNAVAAPVAKNCPYKGQTYHFGESFQPTPCEHCFCTYDGLAMCTIADCFYTPCVDAINDPTQCCSVCPNGENCKHTDGTIIKKGEVYHPDPNTTCKCSDRVSSIENMAECAVTEE